MNKHTLPKVFCGPAIKARCAINTDKDPYFATGVDCVCCLFCPEWPRDGYNWYLPPRNNGWPTSETISEVVRNGCQVVYVQHRACREDEYQWRLSFSVAEVILLRSWTKIQQIAYHLLKFFAKKEFTKKNCPKEDEVLCTYRLKTLMLWTCEEMSPEWWDSSPVIAMCCELLKILSDWLKRRYFPNYFIPETNLVHQLTTPTQLHQTERRVNYFRKNNILSRWFVENYILPITLTQLQSLNTSKLSPDFMDYMLPLLEYRKVALPLSVEWGFAFQSLRSNTSIRMAIRTKSAGLRLELKSEHSNSNFNLCLHFFQ